MKVRGTIGGHRGTRIYGRLDCPSALRAIAKGGYVKHRVFFADEAAAVAAGYRPCARCMPERYREWKASVGVFNSSAGASADAGRDSTAARWWPIRSSPHRT